MIIRWSASGLSVYVWQQDADLNKLEWFEMDMWMKTFWLFAIHTIFHIVADLCCVVQCRKSFMTMISLFRINQLFWSWWCFWVFEIFDLIAYYNDRKCCFVFRHILETNICSSQVETFASSMYVSLISKFFFSLLIFSKLSNRGSWRTSSTVSFIFGFILVDFRINVPICRSIKEEYFN